MIMQQVLQAIIGTLSASVLIWALSVLLAYVLYAGTQRTNIEIMSGIRADMITHSLIAGVALTLFMFIWRW